MYKRMWIDILVPPENLKSEYVYELALKLHDEEGANVVLHDYETGEPVQEYFYDDEGE